MTQFLAPDRGTYILQSVTRQWFTPSGTYILEVGSSNTAQLQMVLSTASSIGPLLR